MTELETKLIEAVTKGGGKLSWKDLMKDLTHRQQQDALKTVRSLESQGKLHRLVSRDKDTEETTFVISAGPSAKFKAKS